MSIGYQTQFGTHAQFVNFLTNCVRAHWEWFSISN